MSKKDDDLLRVMFLSGTVSVPPRLPDVADISFKTVKKETLVIATQKVSPKLLIKRSFSDLDVTSIFVPENSEKPDMEKGEWFEGVGLRNMIAAQQPIKGVVYVREYAQSILDVQAGLTAAESVEYYPPLPDDRSVNHYNMDPSGKRAGCYV